MFNNIQAIHHEKLTLESRKVTKLLRRDTTSSNNDFPSYVQSIKLIFTRYTTLPVANDTLDLYCEGAVLSKFIHEGRPTTTKRLSLLFESSDETIRRLYGIPSNENYLDDHCGHDRQDSSISSQLVEYCPRYKRQSAT